MSLKPNGGCAFPADPSQRTGMFLRDYFAAKAMASVLDKHTAQGKLDPSAVAKAAYIFADAMLQERVKA